MTLEQQSILDLATIIKYMIEKRLLEAIFKRTTRGSFSVTYWDGTTTTYGKGPVYFRLTIKRPSVVRSIIKNMTLGFGESYMSDLIEIDGDPENIGRLVSENKQAFGKLAPAGALSLRRANTRRTQQSLISHHYDLGNDFYKLWLDRSMTYSCGYFRRPDDSLEQAQEQKREHILAKLQLSKGQTLLDIGSGWGALCINAAQRYQVKAHGVTLSREQYEFSLAAAQKANLEKQVTFELVNYQDLAARDVEYDRIVSVGMFEHVGRKNQLQYYKAVNKMLKPGGLSVLHTITNQIETRNDPWIDKYIFPGGYIPSVRQIVRELPVNDFRLLDYENLRLHYALTLEEWRRRYEAHKREVVKMNDERFYRMWRLYLASSAAGFRYGDLSLSQFVFTKGLNNDLPLTREHLYGKH